MLRLQDIVEAQKSLLRFRECFALFFLKGIPLDMGYLCIYLFWHMCSLAKVGNFWFCSLEDCSGF